MRKNQNFFEKWVSGRFYTFVPVFGPQQTRLNMMNGPNKTRRPCRPSFFPLSNSKQFSLHDIWWISKWVLNYVYVKFLYYSNDFIFHRNDLPPLRLSEWNCSLILKVLVLSVFSVACSFHEKMCIYIIRIPCSVGSFVSIQFFAFGP